MAFLPRDRSRDKRSVRLVVAAATSDIAAVRIQQGYFFDANLPLSLASPSGPPL
jgi:hypothetical protein